MYRLKAAFRISLARGLAVACLLPSVATGTSPIVASVNDRAIRSDEVLYFLPPSAGTRPSEQVWSAAVDLAIDRCLVLAALQERKQVVDERTIDKELARLDREFARRGSSLSERLDQRNIATDSFRNVLRWQLTWKRYLNGALTDENLQRYYRKHKRDFDGTKIRAAHILLPRGDNESDTAERIKQAHRMLREIRSEAMSFESAVAQHSIAPSATSDGDVGWIERHQPMSIEFTEAAFELNPGQISSPVVSSAGIHLIRCTEVEPGKRTWLEARERLTESVRKYLFKWLADQQRPTANIRRSRLPGDTSSGQAR